MGVRDETGGVMKMSATPEEAELMERAIEEGCERVLP